MSDVVKVFAIMCAKNVAVLICFTILAVFFNHWWLVLLSVLFLSYPKNERDKK